MKIGIAALGRVSEDTGGKNYLVHFIRALELLQSPHMFVLFLSAGEAPALGIEERKSLKIVVIPNSRRTPLHKVFGEQALLPYFIAREKVDIVYFPGNFISLCSRVPSVVNVRSAAHFYGKKYGIGGMRKIIRSILMPISVRKALAVITPSEDIKKDVVRFAHVSREKITVIPHGVELALFDGEKNRRAPEGYTLLQKYGLAPGSYLLYVSALWRYKQQDQLIRAHAALVREGFHDLKLVLAGMGTGTERRYIAELHALAKEMGTARLVVFTGGLSQTDLRYLYAHARAFIFPSAYESFGNPIFEAWASGIPIAVSMVHSFPEIVEKAGLFFDPASVSDIRYNISRLIQEPLLREALIGLGKYRSQQFSWETTVLRTLTLLESVNRASLY